MDKNKNLIVIENKDKTEDILSIDFEDNYINIKYANNKVYKYKKEKVKIFDSSNELNPLDYMFYLDGTLLSNIVKIEDFKKYFRIFYQNGKKTSMKFLV
jgi:hypothetical protein